MANRRSGLLNITNPGTGSQSSGTVTGVVAEYTDASGFSFGTNVSVGDYLFAFAQGALGFRWKISNITAQTFNSVTFDADFDEENSGFPSAVDGTPIRTGEAAITEPFELDGPSIVPSLSVSGISDALAAVIATTNDFYESGGPVTALRTWTGTQPIIYEPDFTYASGVFDNGDWEIRRFDPDGIRTTANVTNNPTVPDLESAYPTYLTLTYA